MITLDISHCIETLNYFSLYNDSLHKEKFKVETVFEKSEVQFELQVQ